MSQNYTILTDISETEDEKRNENISSIFGYHCTSQ